MTTHTIALGPEFDTLPDDTEESVLGTSLHQAAITMLYVSLHFCSPRRGLPWFIGNQLKIVVPRRGGKAPYMPYPDIMIHPALADNRRTSLPLAVEGPPALVIEVASPATALDHDVNLISPTGKPAVYEAMGIPEYLVFDPTAEILDPPVWARRTSPRGYVPWTPEADGRWHSAALGIAFEPRGLLLRVYDQDGALVPLADELADQVEERDRQLAEQARQLAALQAEVRRLRGE